MGRMLPLQQGSGPDRVAQIWERIEPLASSQRRFSQTISVSDEIDAGLPFRGLPLGCIHEVRSTGLACGVTFASMMAGRIPGSDRQMVYVAPDRSFHPLGLLPYGIPPERWIHASVKEPLNLAWTVLEALRCPQVGAVLAVMKGADLTLCRRLQLAAEGSGATGFLLSDSALKPAVVSVITRWQISSVPTPSASDFGEPGWTIELTYCRGGRPGRWNTVWREGKLELRTLSKPTQRLEFAADRLAG